MRYVLAVALILAAAIGLAWHRTSTLQADLVGAVEAALVAADAEEVLVSVDGMGVTLAGVVPDVETKERIDRAVARLPSVGGRFVSAIEVAAGKGPEAMAESARAGAGDAVENTLWEAPQDAARSLVDPISLAGCQALAMLRPRGRCGISRSRRECARCRGRRR
jgi:hypothetical protein